MPASSWFHKLRRRKSKRSGAACRNQAAADAGAVAVATSAACADGPRSQCQPPTAPSQPPAACAGYSPNRASYYFASADRARPDGGLRCIARRGGDDDDTALDVSVDVVHRRADRLDGIDAPPATPELRLRPIVTRPAAKSEPYSDNAGSSSATTSAATTPSTRARGFHVKPAGRRRRRGPDNTNARKEKAAAASLHGGTTRRRRWLYESLVVVKASSDPERELAESMAEMVVANNIRSSEDLEELLACYLALNAAEHHRAVVAAFRRVWLHLARQRLVPPT